MQPKMPRLAVAEPPAEVHLSGEQINRMCCSIIEAFPEANTLRHRTIVLMGEIGACIQNGSANAEREILRLRLRDLLDEYRRYHQ